MQFSQSVTACCDSECPVGTVLPPLIMLEPREVTVREDIGTVEVCPKAETVVCLSVHSEGIEAGMICTYILHYTIY